MIKCPISGFRFAPFANWLAVKHAAETNETMFYHAPLDFTPRRVLARKIFKNGKIRLSVGDMTFTADPGHLHRFLWLEPSKVVDK